MKKDNFTITLDWIGVMNSEKKYRNKKKSGGD